MYPFDDPRVPILWRLVLRVADRKDWRRHALKIELSNFPITKRLSERWKPLKEIGEASHRRQLRTTLAQETSVAKRILQFTLAAVVGSLLLPGCAYMSKEGRQQMAYQRYVKKCQKMRYRQHAKIAKQQLEIPTRPPPKYKVTVGTIDTPQSAVMSESPVEPQGEQ